MNPEIPRTLDVRIIDGHPTYEWRVMAASTEHRWLPALGPTAWLAARRLVAEVGSEGERVNLAAFASQLGVGPSRLWAAMSRLERQRLARITVEGDHALVTVLRTWPNPPERGVR